MRDAVNPENIYCFIWAAEESWAQISCMSSSCVDRKTLSRWLHSHPCIQKISSLLLHLHQQYIAFPKTWTIAWEECEVVNSAKRWMIRSSQCVHHEMDVVYWWTTGQLESHHIPKGKNVLRPSSADVPMANWALSCWPWVNFNIKRFDAIGTTLHVVICHL